LIFSEYLPNFESARTTTDLPAGTEQLVVLDTVLRVPPADAAFVREIVLREQPRVSVWLVNPHGARAVEHGYQFLRLI
jgi:hypothetical protein